MMELTEENCKVRTRLLLGKLMGFGFTRLLFCGDIGTLALKYYVGALRSSESHLFQPFSGSNLSVKD